MSYDSWKVWSSSVWSWLPRLPLWLLRVAHTCGRGNQWVGSGEACLGLLGLAVLGPTLARSQACPPGFCGLGALTQKLLMMVWALLCPTRCPLLTSQNSLRHVTTRLVGSMSVARAS